MSTLSASTPSATSANSKRHSLNISIGPRPLQLVDAAGGPQTAPLAQGAERGVWSFESKLMSPPASASPRLPHAKAVRRQSSISYNAPDSPSPYNRHVPVGRSPSMRSSALAGQRDSTSSLSSNGDDRVEREPLTLVEKHAELLHFIAQKESKCLELRSQLSVHEAELLQLKRKWERIVAKGANTTSASPQSTTSVAPSPQPQPSSTQSQDVNAMMMGGFKEVGRWMAALSNVPSPDQTSSPQSTRPSHKSAKSTESRKAKSSDDEAEDEDEDATIHPSRSTPVPQDDLLLGAHTPSARSQQNGSLSAAQQAAAPSIPGLGSISVAAPWVGKKLEELSGLTLQQARSGKRASLQLFADGLSNVLSPTTTPSLAHDHATSSSKSPNTTTSRSRKRMSTPSLSTSSSNSSSLLDDDDDDFFEKSLLTQRSADNANFKVMTPMAPSLKVMTPDSTNVGARMKDSAHRKHPTEETVFEQEEEWNW
ncbi:hypothetical protein BD626DRAFT_514914 [Schizophyllum amplum]|uniref:Uncharacterized protein n=1 Tax=Schizophyllum amplum TaxID=97359 RepID=A0A550BY64_9AGAR|nr:hypothetical protein BD626DRAFT_514914 [Auriculariopsis ampla]